MQWVPAPKAGFQRNWTGNVESLALEDGRQAINVSAQKRTQYVGDFFGDYSNPDGVDIDVFNAYASGVYGRGPIVFANPYAFRQNLFAPHWANPALVEQGWSPLVNFVTTSSPVVFGTSAASGGRPTRYALYDIQNTPYTATSSANQFNQYIAIPPGYILNVGASGQASGTAGVVVQPFLATDNSADNVTMLTLLDPTGSTHVNATFDGNIYNAVRIFLTRTDRSDSTLLLSSMMAQLVRSGTPLGNISHVPGQGSLGLKIVGSAIAETYNYGGMQKGLNLTLEETI